jgi:sulfite exporter TauE/SafE
MFGERLNINSTVQSYIQAAAGLYMIIVALNLLEVHPIFRYLLIQPPKKLAKLAYKELRSSNIFAPIILGVLTIFIPCGTTLAVEAFAISSSNPLEGAQILAAFTLGTMPLFLGIGFLFTFLKNSFQKKFMRFAAVVILILGVISLNGSLVALGSPIHLQGFGEALSEVFLQDPSESTSSVVDNNVTIFISDSGYDPNVITVKKNQPVNVKLVTKDSYTCASAFRIPSLGINKNLLPNDSQEFSFTPTRDEIIPFNCSMGMYRGVFKVI